MADILLALFASVVGAGVAFFLLEKRRNELTKLQTELDARQATLAKSAASVAAVTEQNVMERKQLMAERESAELKLQASRSQLAAERDEFSKLCVPYRDLLHENAILKRDLCNIDLVIRERDDDREHQSKRQTSIDECSRELAAVYLKDNVRWISKSLNANNFSSSKQKLLDVVERCRRIGFEISDAEQDELLGNLRDEYEKIVRAALEREEQNRIKAQIREEQRREKEIERHLEQLHRERDSLQAALERALAAAKDQHSAEIEQLKAKLAEAEERSKRAVSQAQLTKSGYVYVISNIGAFGRDIFKIGMTRRLEPQDRVQELGDASVPFPFDVHMMISSNDAPALENALHHAFHRHRLNKANPKKEFFKIDLDSICQVVKDHHGDVQYVADAEALEYHQSLTMSDEDQEFIESVYDQATDDVLVTEE